MFNPAKLAARVATGISRSFGGPFFPALAISSTEPVKDMGGSIVTAGTTLMRPCMAQVDVVTEAMRQAEGYTDRDVRILVLRDTLDGGIDTDAQVEVLEGPNAGAFMIARVGGDPLGLYHDLTGRAA